MLLATLSQLFFSNSFIFLYEVFQFTAMYAETAQATIGVAIDVQFIG
ncbi:hypothetical protein HOG21_02075 [bacterium]|jgi:hypothetical protein|nr:hypothetical protein [bacterium]